MKNYKVPRYIIDDNDDCDDDVLLGGFPIIDNLDSLREMNITLKSVGVCCKKTGMLMLHLI